MFEMVSYASCLAFTLQGKDTGTRGQGYNISTETLVVTLDAEVYIARTVACTFFNGHGWISIKFAAQGSGNGISIAA
jgi:hypothetical protein